MAGLPRTRRRSIHASRNLSRAHPAALRDLLRQPWTEPGVPSGLAAIGFGEAGSGKPDVADRSERVWMPALESTDQKV